MSALSPIEASKKLAAFKSIDNHVRDGDVVGIGSGSTIVYAVERLSERVKSEGIKVRCIPTSFQARQLIQTHGLILSSLETDPRCSVTIDGCDEADSDLTLIKGGGGCLAQEKVVAYYSDLFVTIADYRFKSVRTRTGHFFVWHIILFVFSPSTERTPLASEPPGNTCPSKYFLWRINR